MTSNLISPVWAPAILIVFLMSRRAIKYGCAVLTFKLFSLKPWW